MKIPSEEFWFKMGSCVAAAQDLRLVIATRTIGDNIFAAQEERAKYLATTLEEIGKAAYEKEDDDRDA